MTPRARLILFAAAMACLLPAVAHVALRMPAFGAHPIPYGDAINALGPELRHVTNMVTAVNFDFRGFDTLGEEFILLCAVTGVTVLLRGTRGEQTSAAAGRVAGRPSQKPSEAVTLTARAAGGLILAWGLAVGLHPTVTPGGGFQGGVLVASGFLLIYLGEGYRGWRKMMRSELLDALEAAGAALYVLCGLAGLAVGQPFLANVLPFGEQGTVWSGGLMLVINAGVLLAVTGGFGVLFLEFMEETREQPGDEGAEGA